MSAATIQIQFNAETQRTRRSAERWSYNQAFLDCGWKRSATPLWKLSPQSESGVAAALCHRSPKSLAGKFRLRREPLRSLRLCVSEANFSQNRP